MKPTHTRPSQATSTKGLVPLKQQFSWLLSGLCLFQETRIKSLQFSLQLHTLLPVNAQYKLQTSEFWMNPKTQCQSKGKKKNGLATIQSPMELEETLSYESFKNKIELDTALENVPWGTDLYWQGNEQDELIV